MHHKQHTCQHQFAAISESKQCDKVLTGLMWSTITFHGYAVLFGRRGGQNAQPKDLMLVVSLWRTRRVSKGANKDIIVVQSLYQCFANKFPPIPQFHTQSYSKSLSVRQKFLKICKHYTVFKINILMHINNQSNRKYECLYYETIKLNFS